MHRVTILAAVLPLLIPGGAGCGDDDGAVCGNGVWEGSESCDGSQLGGKTCASQGFTGGALRCTAACTFDTSGCVSAVCGNGHVDPGEECDGASLGSRTCASLGHTGGDLACHTDCTFDQTGCADTCGDGILDADYEACDGTDFGARTCTGQGSFDGGTLACSGDCHTLITTGCCANQCPTVGATSCNGTVLQTCELQGTGCLGFTSHDCAGEGQICEPPVGGSAAFCADPCTSDCSALDARRCVGDRLDVCAQVGSCLRWQIEQDCGLTGICLEAGVTAQCVTSGSGDTCADAEFVQGVVHHAGSDFTADYTDGFDWDAHPTCGTYAAGADAVFQVWLEAGQEVHVAETGGLDAVIRILDPCDATCLLSTTSPEDVRFAAPSDGFYFVAVEAFLASPSVTDYDITVSVLSPETDCTDGVDNDQDGLTDCDDPQCFGQAGCTTETNCGDGQDNDADGQDDCTDADCTGVSPCEPTEVTCDDSLDNDGDGQDDCNDADCASFVDCRTRWGVWEFFYNLRLVDISLCTLSFTPNGATYLHDSSCGLSALPVTPGSGTVSSQALTLADDDSAQVPLQGTWAFPYFGWDESSFWVGSNGFITFGAGDDLGDDSQSFWDFPRIAGFDIDLDPSAGGTITVDELADSVAVSFEDVPVLGSSDTVTFQIVLHDNGNIEIHYLSITVTDDGIIGLSNGGPNGTDPHVTDFVLPPAAFPGDIVISEILSNPSISEPQGEWVELFNQTGSDIDLAGCTVEDNTPGNAHTFGSVTLPAWDYLVLVADLATAQAEGIPNPYEVGAALQLNNGGDRVVLRCGGVLVDEVDFSGWSVGGDGIAMQLSTFLFDPDDNDLEAAWCDATASFGSNGQLGTPGSKNGQCSPTYLLDEGFTAWPPTGWSIEDGGDTTDTWMQCDPSGGTGCDQGQFFFSVGAFAMVNDDVAGMGIRLAEGLVTPPLDCSTATVVLLSFEHNYQDYWMAPDYARLEISVDGGNSYTPLQTWDVSTDTDGETVNLDISAESAGEADVRLRWIYDDGNDWGLWWMVDSVEVVVF